MIHLRPASEDDVESIFALKRDAFGDDLLRYSMFQAPQSIHYLRELLAHQSESFLNSFVVVCRADEVLGYYHAVRRNADFFLSYIAVAATAQGQGLGNLLLKHYEDSGRALGFHRLMLDVSDSNQRVRDWYLSHGYGCDTVSFSAIIVPYELASTGAFSLRCDVEAWAHAVEEEQARGFSKVKCLCGSGEITVGLIGGGVCKLLDHEGIGLDDAVLAVAHRFCAERTALIVTSISTVPPDWPLLSVEKRRRLSKFI